MGLNDGPCFTDFLVARLRPTPGLSCISSVHIIVTAYRSLQLGVLRYAGFPAAGAVNQQSTEQVSFSREIEQFARLRRASISALRVRASTNRVRAPASIAATHKPLAWQSLRLCSTVQDSQSGGRAAAVQAKQTWISAFESSLRLQNFVIMTSKIRRMSRNIQSSPSVYFCADVTVQSSVLDELATVLEGVPPSLVQELKQDRHISPSIVLGAFEEGADKAPNGRAVSEEEPWFAPAAELRAVDRGLLHIVLNTKFYDFILSQDYDRGIQSLIATVQDVLKELPAATRRAREEALADIAEGRPPKDYLKDAHYLDVPDCSWVPRLSERAKDLKFEIKGDFKGPDLETAVRNRIASAADAGGSSLVAAVRDSLLLIGEALVAVSSFDGFADAPVLPIVDARCGSEREFWLDVFLKEAFATTTFGSSVMRGGVTTGFRGYGKSYLMRNVIFGKALVRWALEYYGEPSMDSHQKTTSQTSVTHVGIYVKDPTGNIGDLRYASPVALIAAGLAKAGIINASSPPDWARTINYLTPQLMGDWLSEYNIHVVLAIDEAQKVRMPDERPRDLHYSEMVSYFWTIMADMINIEYRRPTVFLTGSYKGLAKEVYGPVEGREVLQDDKFLVNAMPNVYSEPELHLMLLRQPLLNDQEPDDVSEYQQGAPFERRVVTAADAVLALAFCLRKRGGLKLGQWWHQAGYYVQPSLEHAVRSLYPDSYVQNALDTNSAPVGRITLEVAERHLQDNEVLASAKSANDRVVRAYMLNGEIARSLGALQGTSVKFRSYIRAMSDRKSLFSRFGVALSRASLAGDAGSKQAILDLDNPFQVMPLVSLSTVKFYLEQVGKEVLPPDQVASDRLKYEDGLDVLLRNWHDDYWLMYHSPEEQKFNQIKPQLGSGCVQFPNLAYARVALQIDLTRDIFLTVREQQALDLPTGDFGEDYELVIAESLRRNFKSKVLDKGRLPSLPRDVYSSKPGVLELTWDRSNPSMPDQELRLGELRDSGSDRKKRRLGVAIRQFSAFGQIFKELPDYFGSDLVVVLRSNPSPENAAKQIFHVIRIQVKAGYSQSQVVGASDLKKILGRDTYVDVHQRYCKLLGEHQTPGNVVMHRLIITSKPVSDPVRKLAGHAEQGGNRPGRKPNAIPQQENMDVIYGADLHDMLFADARLYLARRRVLLSETEEEAHESYLALSTVLDELARELGLGTASMAAGKFDSTSLAEALWKQRRQVNDVRQSV